MSISTSRPFAASAYPTSPAPTTASSLNYSQYGSTPFVGTSASASTSRGNIPSVSSSSYSGPSLRLVQPNGSGGGAGAARSGGGKKQGERKMESKEVARVHWRALKEFLETWIKDESPSARASAREKLTRLTKLQFQELSTDVYDELMRRLAAEKGGPDGALPFLPVRDDFHPKRNQARQKLATLPRNRFKDLASDVYYELRRRYPEFEQEERYDEPPAPGPVPLRNPYTSSSQPQPIPQPDRSRVNPTPPPMSRLNSSSSHQRQGSRNISASSVATHRSRPSRDLIRDRDTRDESMEQLDSSDQPPTQPNLTAATSEVVVPNKSRMREEEIEVPYARDSVVEPTRPGSRSMSRNASRHSFRAGDRDSRMSASTAASLSGVERNRGPKDNKGESPQDMLSPNLTNDDREYYDRMSFSSNVTNKSKVPPGGGTGWDEDKEEKIRTEYEFRIAGLERRAAVAEQEREEARKAEAAERDRRREWEEEVRGLKERATTHASTLRSLQHELDIARDAAETTTKQGEQRARAAEEEISQWRDRCDALEDELRRVENEKTALDSRSGGNSDAAVDELKTELHSLVEELNALSMRNDELMAEREQDAQGMNEMEAKVEEYKRKYDAVRIELRNLKATSTMFVSKPLTDDHLPASPDGNIADVNVSAFQTSIDGLLGAARSSAPTGVLPAMKSIVEAVTEIGEDVKSFEAAPNLDVDVNRLESLKYESTARLNNLMQAARNHAMASGLSPVSLLDAAAGHLSGNVVEIIKLLKIRRTVSRRRSSLSIKEMVSRDAPRANQEFDREYGGGAPGAGDDERLRDPNPPAARRQAEQVPNSAPSYAKPSSRTATPDRLAPGGFGGGTLTQGAYGNAATSAASAPPSAPPNFRINSFQSASSQGRQSDAFELERKASVTSDRANPRAIVTAGNNDDVVEEIRDRVNGYRVAQERAPSAAGRSVEGERGEQRGMGVGMGVRGSVHSNTSESSVMPVTANEEEGYRMGGDEGGDEGEWEELKPYLNTQSSALVNSIQNLLASIRTGNSSPQLNEHLSEVIAIASSIVAVAGNALPHALRGEGDTLLQDLVGNTNRLSEAQELAKKGGFEKGVRQGIASASFGVAKALKSLMKLGVE